MKKLTFALAVCLVSGMAYAASPVRPGKWEMTMHMEMSGMPMKMPPTTHTYCVTKEQAENPEWAAPQDSRKNADCKRTDFKIDGNVVTWKVTCEKSKMTGEGKVTYTNDSFDGTMHMTMPNGGEMNGKYSGKYLGACDK